MAAISIIVATASKPDELDALLEGLQRWLISHKYQCAIKQLRNTKVPSELSQKEIAVKTAQQTNTQRTQANILNAEGDRIVPEFSKMKENRHVIANLQSHWL